MSKTNDKQRVLEYLRKHGAITPMDALNSIGCYRLGARIFDLRHDGYRIDTEIIHDTDRFGEAMHYAKYTLREDTYAQTTAP